MLKAKLEIAEGNRAVEILQDNIGDAHNNSGFYSIIKNKNKVMNQILLGDNK